MTATHKIDIIINGVPTETQEFTDLSEAVAKLEEFAAMDIIQNARIRRTGPERNKWDIRFKEDGQQFKIVVILRRAIGNGHVVVEGFKRG